MAVHVPVYTLRRTGNADLSISERGACQRIRSDENRLTTPDNPAGPDGRINIYVFTHEAWAEPDMLHRYVAARGSTSPEDRSLRDAFEKAVRGYYGLDESGEEGRIGPIDGMKERPDSPGDGRLLTCAVQRATQGRETSAQTKTRASARAMTSAR